MSGREGKSRSTCREGGRKQLQFWEMAAQALGPLPGGRTRLTLHKAGRLCGVSRRTYGRWVRGTCLPQTFYALKFAQAFGLDEEDVLAAIARQERDGGPSPAPATRALRPIPCETATAVSGRERGKGKGRKGARHGDDSADDEGEG